MSMTIAAARRGKPIASCTRDLSFGEPSLLRAAAVRLSTAGELPWRSLHENPGPLEQDRVDLAGFYQEDCNSDEEFELVRCVIDELLKPRPGTGCFGFAHLRDVVDSIGDLSLEQCWDWDTARTVSRQRVTREALDYVSERLVRECVLSIPPRRRCLSCHRTMHHVEPPPGGVPPAMPREMGPITADTVPLPPEQVAPRPTVEELLERAGWLLWLVIKPCGHLICHHCFFEHARTSRRAITEPVLCKGCGVPVGLVRPRHWYGQLSQVDVDHGAAGASAAPDMGGGAAETGDGAEVEAGTNVGAEAEATVGGAARPPAALETHLMGER